MRSLPAPTLAGTSGSRVDAEDGPVGRVVTPLFTRAAGEPDYLIVRAGSSHRSRRLIIPTVLVRSVDHGSRAVVVGAPRSTIDRLPGHLPLCRRV